jgi:hypothetical protein
MTLTGFFRASPDGLSHQTHWLTQQSLPGFPSQPGIASAHLFDSTLGLQMTPEQLIRGKDANLIWVLLVIGHD